MGLTDEEHIRELVQELDAAVPREGKVAVRGSTHDGGTVVRANQVGYLRLGIEFLKAAFADPRSEVLPELVELDLDYLTELEDQRYSFERSEDVDTNTGRPESSGDGGILGGAVAILFIASLLVGALTILGWLLKLFF